MKKKITITITLAIISAIKATIKCTILPKNPSYFKSNEQVAYARWKKKNRFKELN